MPARRPGSRLSAIWRGDYTTRPFSLIPGSSVKHILTGLVHGALDQLRADGRIVLDALPEITFERTRAKEFGDFACNIAMQLAKPLGRKPREIAEWIVATLPAHPSLAKVDIAGPGFLNFFVTSATLQQVVAREREPAHDWQSPMVDAVVVIIQRLRVLAVGGPNLADGRHP